MPKVLLRFSPATPASPSCMRIEPRASAAASWPDLTVEWSSSSWAKAGAAVRIVRSAVMAIVVFIVALLEDHREATAAGEPGCADGEREALGGRAVAEPASLGGQDVDDQTHLAVQAEVVADVPLEAQRPLEGDLAAAAGAEVDAPADRQLGALVRDEGVDGADGQADHGLALADVGALEGEAEGPVQPQAARPVDEVQAADPGERLRAADADSPVHVLRAGVAGRQQPHREDRSPRDDDGTSHCTLPRASARSPSACYAGARRRP